MELVGALLFFLALSLLVVIFILRPFIRKETAETGVIQSEVNEQEHLRSSLMAERDRVLNALQDLDFDFVLGKVPEEDYPQQRAVLLKTGAEILRRLDETQSKSGDGAVSAVFEDRIEAAVAARRADARTSAGNGNGTGEKDSLEEMIATAKRRRKETAGGFCPKCGKPVSKSDKFCSKCGSIL